MSKKWISCPSAFDSRVSQSAFDSHVRHIQYPYIMHRCSELLVSIVIIKKKKKKSTSKDFQVHGPCWKYQRAPAMKIWFPLFLSWWSEDNKKVFEYSHLSIISFISFSANSKEISISLSYTELRLNCTYRAQRYQKSQMLGNQYQSALQWDIWLQICFSDFAETNV